MKKEIEITLTAILSILFIVSIIMLIIPNNLFLMMGIITYFLGLINIFILKKGLPRTVSKAIMFIINLSLIIIILIASGNNMYYLYINKGVFNSFSLILTILFISIISLEEYFIVKIDIDSEKSLRILYIILGIIILLTITLIIGFAGGPQ